MKAFNQTDAAYEQRLRDLEVRSTEIGQIVTLPGTPATIDEWHAAIKQRQQPSPRVVTKLQQLWDEHDYQGLAHLLQFTPAKYSVVRQPVSVVTSHRPISRLLSAQIYELTPGTATHALIFLHGGGLVNGTAERNADWLQYLLTQLGSDWLIVNVDYPLITQITLPTLLAEITQVSAVVQQWLPNVKLYLAGDSSGAALAMQTGAANRPLINGQVLIYPQWQFGGSTQPKHPLALPLLNDFNRMLNVQTALINQQIAAPLSWQLDATMPTLIIKAEHDIFNADLATRITGQQPQLQVTAFQGLMHGFIDYFGVLPQAQVAAMLVSEWLQQQ